MNLLPISYEFPLYQGVFIYLADTYPKRLSNESTFNILSKEPSINVIFKAMLACWIKVYKRS